MKNNHTLTTRIISVIFSILVLTAISFAHADTLQLPHGLKRIEEEAFYGDTSLDEVVIPNGVTYIGPRAFANSSLKYITLPASLTSIADDAFDGVLSSAVLAPSDNSYASDWCKTHSAKTPADCTLSIGATSWAPSASSSLSSTKSITVKCDDEYEVTIDQPGSSDRPTSDGFVSNWLSYTTTSTGIKLKVENNYAKAARKATVTVMCKKHHAQKTITVTQSASTTSSPTVTMTLNPTTVAPGESFTATVKVKYTRSATVFAGYEGNETKNEQTQSTTSSSTIKTLTYTFTVPKTVRGGMYTVTASACNSDVVHDSWTQVAKATAELTVKVPVAVTGISLQTTSVDLVVGETSTLVATVNPTDASDKSITWSSSDTTIATVSSSGVVTAKGIGTATITATTVDGGKTAKCTVYVEPAPPVPPTTIKLNYSERTLEVGDTYTLRATLSPDNVTEEYTEVVWGSYNTNVAIVSSTGKITAIGVGQTVIYARTLNGLSAYCDVTVTPVVTMSGTFENDALTICAGTSDHLRFTAEISGDMFSKIQLKDKSAGKVIDEIDCHGKINSISASFLVSSVSSNEYFHDSGTYSLQLVGVSANGAKVTLDTATVVVEPELPAIVYGVSASYSVSSRINVSWTNAGDADRFYINYISVDDYIAGYACDYKGVSGSSSSSYISLSSSDVGKTYYVWVTAKNGAGENEMYSERITVQTYSNDTPAISVAFANGKTVYAPGETITLEITYKNCCKVHYSNGDNDYNSNSYDDGVNKSGDIGSDTSANSSGTKSVTLKAQSRTGSYHVQVWAKNSGGTHAENSYNNHSTDTGYYELFYTVASSLEAPAVTVGTVGNNSATLQWNAVSGATGYNVLLATANDASTAGLIEIGKQTSYTIENLNANTTYYVWIQATNSNGAGNLSSYKLFTTSNQTSPSVSASFVNGKTSYKPGETISINVTYSNVIKVHYSNGDNAYNANSFEGNNDGDIWANSTLKEDATSNVSGTKTITLPAQQTPGTYHVQFWAKDASGQPATNSYNYNGSSFHLVYTVSGTVSVVNPEVSMKAETSTSIPKGCDLGHCVWLTVDYKNADHLKFELLQGSTLETFTNYYQLNELKKTSLSSIEFDVNYSTSMVPFAMSFIPSDALAAGTYTFRVTATNNTAGSVAKTATIQVMLRDPNAFDPIWPCSTSYTVTCLYRYKDGTKHSTRYQTGIDIGGSACNIVAVEAGEVITSTTLTGSFGKYVVIQHDNGMVSLYGHLASLNVKVGNQVQKGDVIGYMGATGNANGVHLHFELADPSTKLGDPWVTYYREKYITKLIYEQNCYLNNNGDDCKNWIKNHYELKSGYYYYKATITPTPSSAITKTSMHTNLTNSTYLGAKREACVMLADLLWDSGFSPAYIAGVLANIHAEGSIGLFENITGYTQARLLEVYPSLQKISEGGSGHKNYIAHMKGFTDYDGCGHDHSEYSTYSNKYIYNGISLQAVDNLLTVYQKENWNAQFGLGTVQWTADRTVKLMKFYHDEAGSADTITYAQCLVAEMKCANEELLGSYYYVFSNWLNANTGALDTANAAYDAGYRVAKYYESPGQTSTYVTRGNSAKNIYSIMSDQ